MRAGEFFIGSKDAPYNGNATVKLYGKVTEESLAFNIAVEGGNKMLAIVNKAEFYGQSRDRMSRLRETVFKDEMSATVDAFLDWHAGDKVALLPTAMIHTHTDYLEIESYDNATGVITFV